MAARLIKAGAALFLGVGAFFAFIPAGASSAAAMDMFRIYLAAAAVWLSRLLPLSFCDFLSLWFLLIIEMSVVSDFAALPSLLFFLLLDLCAAICVFQKGIKGYGFCIASAVFAAAGVSVLFDFTFGYWIGDYYTISRFYGWDALQKAAVLGTAAAFCTVLMWLFFRIVGRCLGRKRRRWRRFTEKYAELDRSVLFVLGICLFSLFCFESIVQFFPEPFQSYTRPLLSALLLVLALVQALYIRIMVKMAFLKERMRTARDEYERISLYNADLEENLDGMARVRHDVKNLFFTMGNFVEKSGNGEMQDFYARNVVPFMKDTLLKNDLYARLRPLGDETLKSFLYYKIMQGVERGVHIELTVSLKEGGADFHLERADLVRILGIFIDNAIEEVCRMESGRILVAIRESGGVCSFSICNSLREETKKKGITAGNSDKGPERGKGLLIVKELLSRYDNVVLNSYFHEDIFVQQLRIDES